MMLRVVRRIIPLTGRGLALLALAVILLLLGILREDMAGLFWGASFLLASLWSVAGGHITRALVSRAVRFPGALEVLLPAAVLSAGESSEAILNVSLPRALPPGFTVGFSLPLAWQERRIKGVRSSLKPGPNRVTLPFRADSRGSYQAAAAVFEARDLLGLVSCPVRLPAHESLRVVPRLAAVDRVPRMVEEGGDSVRYASRRRRSEEMLEVRKYFPGDDVRRLNWKVFAHAGELFLRIGEETPPPESRFLFLLDSTANPLVPVRAAADYLDTLVESCAALMSTLMARGSELLFWSPESPASRSFGSESRSELMRHLSGVWWADPGWRIELPARAGMHAVVFSTPGSPSLFRIMTEISGRGWRASLVLPDLQAPARVRPRATVRRLLLLPREPGAGAPAFGEKTLSPFRQAMAEARARYGGQLTGGSGDARQG